MYKKELLSFKCKYYGEMQILTETLEVLQCSLGRVM